MYAGFTTEPVNIGPFSPVCVMMYDVFVGSVDSAYFYVADGVHSTSVYYGAVNAEKVWKGWGPCDLEPFVDIDAMCSRGVIHFGATGRTTRVVLVITSIPGLS